jgi:hypothetical protein
MLILPETVGTASFLASDIRAATILTVLPFPTMVMLVTKDCTDSADFNVLFQSWTTRREVVRWFQNFRTFEEFTLKYSNVYSQK